MSRPDKCKWCGCAEVVTETLVMTAFRCFSSHWSDNQQWDLSEACAMKCAGQVLQLRQRIADAVERSQRAMRFVADPIGIECVFARDLDRVIEILEGSYPEIPDGSNTPENQEGSP